jgi:hypothetical protein
MAASEIVAKLIRKLPSRVHTTPFVIPMMVAAPSHTGKIASWTAAATPMRYLRPVSSAFDSPAVMPITAEIAKLASGPLKAVK